MAKYIDAKCRLCRREGVKLYLKGARCFSPKCPIDKKGAQIPGQHGKKQGRPRLSNFGVQLREKQKAKRLYAVLEKQFHRYYEQAIKSPENTGEVLLQQLESRLDNVVYRLGLVASRSLGRQLVSHGHILVNGQKIDIPSFQVQVGQTVSIKPKSEVLIPFAESLKSEDAAPAAWMSRKGTVGKFDRLPSRSEIGGDIRENLIIEYYSR